MQDTPIFKYNLDLLNGGIGIGDLNINVGKLLSSTIQIGAIILFMYLCIKIGGKIIDRTTSTKRKIGFNIDEKKSRTLRAVLKSILRYTVYFFGVTGILTVLFGGITLTIAGIGGVAIGFGTQSLVKDVINGFFILFEDQFSVGDYINLEDKAGTVESVELRVTKIRDFNGDLHIIPNGLITKVTNHSKGDMRILVDVDIAPEEDVENAMAILEEVCVKFKAEEPNLVDGPRVVGVTALKENGVTIRVIGRAKSMTQWDCEMKLRKQMLNALAKERIEMSRAKIKLLKEV